MSEVLVALCCVNMLLGVPNIPVDIIVGVFIPSMMLFRGMFRGVPVAMLIVLEPLRIGRGEIENDLLLLLFIIVKTTEHFSDCNAQ